MNPQTIRFATEALRRNATRICWSIVALAGIGSAIGLAVMYRTMAPIQRGTSHRFWNVATDLALSEDVASEWGGDAWFMDETWAAYDEANLHGSRMYYVPIDEVMADFTAVVAAFQQAQASGSKLISVQDYLTWRDDPKSSHDALSLVKHIRQGRRRHAWERRSDSVSSYAERDLLFHRRWRQCDWYWASVPFEWLHLTGLTLFVMWPGIRRQSIFHWAAHVAGVPMLFFGPLYLGYATMSLTSAGPSGGILYPWLLLLCRGGSTTSLDEQLLKYVPPLLEPLSAPIGIPMALTGFGMPGPTSAALNGITSAVLLLATHFGYRWWSVRHGQVSE